MTDPVLPWYAWLAILAVLTPVVVFLNCRSLSQDERFQEDRRHHGVFSALLSLQARLLRELLRDFALLAIVTGLFVSVVAIVSFTR